jgi:hypothetical protein
MVKKDILSILVGVGFTLADQLLGNTGYCKLKIIMHSHNTQSTIKWEERERETYFIFFVHTTQKTFLFKPTGLPCKIQQGYMLCSQ